MMDGPAPSSGGDRPARNFGPPAPRRHGPARRPTKQETRPRGPIRERNTGRVFDVDDGEGEVEEFDNLASSASGAEEDEQE
jgi:hypothetical protein